VQVACVATSHLVVGADIAALVDAGLSAEHERLIAGVKGVLEELNLEYVFLTHISFDHVGGLPYLRRAFPGLKVFGSPASAELLTDKALLKQMYDQNRDCADAMQVEFKETFAEWSAGIKIDQIVRDGDSVAIGDGVEVKVIAVPGYSKDAHAYFILPDSALAAGHAFGDFGGRDKIFFAFKDSLTDFVASLDKMSQLALKAVQMPHSGALTGDLANRSLFRLREDVLKFQAQVKERAANGELTDDIFSNVYAEWLELGMVPDGPFVESSKSSLRRMIEIISQSH